MSEQELKLHIPAHARETIASSMKKYKAESIALRALYFDTPDRQLAKAKVALRLRLEGKDWVQTLKMAGSNSLTRVELNHHRPSPVLDLSLYVGTPAEPLLTSLNKPLELRYETDVVRLLRKRRTRKGTVEIAFDTGVVRAGNLELPISEVEFELKAGDISALFELGQRWLKQYKLLLDLRTKSHRGDALANMYHKISQADETAQAKIEQQETHRFWAERKAKPYYIPKQSSATQALCLLSEECLDQITQNAAYLAEIDTAGVINVARPEHVHQLRIGMRRLVSNWRLFSKLAHLPDSLIQNELKTHLRRFGATRDTDVMLATIVPPLERAGMPHFEVDHYQGESATQIAQDPVFQSWILSLLEWIVTTPRTDPQKEASAEDASAIVPPLEPALTEDHDAVEATTDTLTTANLAQLGDENTLTMGAELASVLEVITSPESLDALESESLLSLQDWAIIPLIPGNQNRTPLRKLLEARLSKWNKEIVAHWRNNDKSDIESYHDLRKKIKRIRYGLNVYEALETHANINVYVKRLAQAQEVFGQLNDYSTALDYFKGITQQHPEAWFAVGWLSANLHVCKKQADQALGQLPKRIRFA